jgi:hypothetical protein
MKVETPESITQDTLIGDADRLLTIDPIVVQTDNDLQHVAESVVKHPGARVIYGVTLMGDWQASYQCESSSTISSLMIVPEEFLGEIADYQQALKYAKHLGAHTAKDIMLDPVAVRMGDSVRVAFE